MERGKVRTGVCGKNLRDIDHLEDLSVNGEIILKSDFKKSAGACIGLMRLKIETCDFGEPSGFINCVNFID
jgi:hypothetical protein